MHKQNRQPQKNTQNGKPLPVARVSPAQGLTAAQVAERMAAGLGNTAPPATSKTRAQIFRDNICTFFNLVFVVLAVCLALVGSWLNMAFMGVVVANTCIGIVQQLRSKKALDALTLVAEKDCRCIRDGQVCLLPQRALVRDDIVELAAGNQIMADALLCTGTARVNEALVTGEAAPVEKRPGDTLRSGSFLVAGHCRAQLTAVGEAAYANALAARAKTIAPAPKSEMMRSLDALIRCIGVALVPMGVVLFAKQYGLLAMPLRGAVEATVAALIGMIPEGLYLLTSVALAVSVVRLARRRVLARDMNCIETLARVDVLCVDKTGTITEAAMEALPPVPLAPDTWPEAALRRLLAAFYTGETPDNDTARAMATAYAGPGTEAAAPEWRRTGTVPFDSAYKWSAVTFAEQGSFVVGAPEFVLETQYKALRPQAEEWMAKGCRVLVLCQCQTAPDPKVDLDAQKLQPLALLPLTNRIRPAAAETFAYFAKQGVAVKVISGDNPMAAGEAARRASIPGTENRVDASTLHTPQQLAHAAQTCTVFGRVTPEQKCLLIQALQQAGHTVAMTGDGVNDVLALKDADCGIAMASGAQAAGQVAQLVLTDSDFAALPAVMAEGRRVINNIERTAALYLVKNVFSFLLSFVLLFATLPYPFQPLQLTLVSAFTIGIPSFCLALEPNHELVRGRFITNVLRKALPGGLTDFLLILCAEAACLALCLDGETLRTMATVLVLAVGLQVLWRVCLPISLPHAVLWGGMAGGAVALAVGLHPVLGLVPLDKPALLTLAALLALSLPAMQGMLYLVKKCEPTAAAWVQTIRNRLARNSAASATPQK